MPDFEIRQNASIERYQGWFGGKPEDFAVQGLLEMIPDA